ncbi:MAG: hypothetical protein AAF628_30855 [Planctomycetota bacterium]
MVEFNDPRLQQTMARCGPVIEGYEGRLDAASADITQLEAYLGTYVQECLVHELSGGIASCPELDQQQGLIGGFSGGEYITGEFEYLVFQRERGRWRLMYVRSRAEGHLAMGGPDPVWCVEQKLERRPLIETKADVRLRAVKVLPAFLEAVAQALGMEPNTNTVDYGDIPF